MPPIVVVLFLITYGLSLFHIFAASLLKECGSSSYWASLAVMAEEGYDDDYLFVTKALKLLKFT